MVEEIICGRCMYLAGKRRRDRNPGIEFGMTADEYWAMFDAQDGRCLICRRAIKLVVDHCHVRLQVRGLLCRDCNLLLGMAKDDPGVLARAIEYLTR